VVCRISDKNLVVAPAAAGAGFEASSRREEQLELNLQLRDTRRKVDESIAMQDWLWDFGGELLVIETNFHKGRHYALSPKEFIPVVAFLQKMHEKGCVHGDIRCANIVFDKCLIDFDLGGRLEDAPAYPSGYASNLYDGSRLGRGLEPITKWHDWYALLTVMFEVHGFHRPATKEDIHQRFVDLLNEVSLADSEIQNLANDLRTFLEEAESWTVTISAKFRRELEKWGVLAREQAPRTTSHPATGSPQEQIR
jgi:hypothetical protein